MRAWLRLRISGRLGSGIGGRRGILLCWRLALCLPRGIGVVLGYVDPALFAGGWALEQLWLFWLAPIVGAAIAGIVYPLIAGETKEA